MKNNQLFTVSALNNTASAVQPALAALDTFTSTRKEDGTSRAGVPNDRKALRAALTLMASTTQASENAGKVLSAELRRLCQAHGVRWVASELKAYNADLLKKNGLNTSTVKTASPLIKATFKTVEAYELTYRQAAERGVNPLEFDSFNAFRRAVAAKAPQKSAPAPSQSAEGETAEGETAEGQTGKAKATGLEADNLAACVAFVALAVENGKPLELDLQAAVNRLVAAVTKASQANQAKPAHKPVRTARTAKTAKAA